VNQKGKGKLLMTGMNAREIIELFEAPEDNGLSIKQRVSAEAPTSELIAAVAEAPSLTRQILCDILGERCEEDAVPVLLHCLYDSSPNIRGSAADALGKIGHSQAGPVLLERFLEEEDRGVKQLLASALGAVGYRPAIPLLIPALDSSDTVLRNCAAWGLGILGAHEAEDALRNVLNRETESAHYRKLLAEALAAVELVAKAQNARKRKTALGLLIPALKTPHLRPAAAWALGTFAARGAVPALQEALAAEEYSCFMAQRIKDALLVIEADTEPSADLQ
jgi:HEAT repeat protein